MDPFYLVVDPDSLELSRGSITGKIHISNAICTFPEPEWNDFVVVVLGCWLEAAAEVSGRQGTEGVLRFMDGPFSIHISSRPEGILALALRAGPARRLVDTWFCEADTVRSEIIRGARSVLAACEANGWMTNDITKLRNSLDLLTSSSARSTGGSGG